MKPDRIVIGVSSPRPEIAMRELYAPFSAPFIVTDTNSAELIKHAANSFLALKISYANALSVVCEAAGANVHEVTRGMGLDARIGTRFLNAGLGFGGSCFPKDLSAFIQISGQLGYDFRLLKEVQRINADQMDRFVKKITDTLWVLKDKRIGVLGLAFKQNTDDVRLSPAIELCQRLLKEGARLRVNDPKAMDKARALLPEGPQVEYVEDLDAVPEGCDAVAVATEWPEFTRLDLARARKSMVTPIFVDGRNLFDPAEMERHGFIYKSIGR
jgi:UDPglucose 6-dehydrogenase